MIIHFLKTWENLKHYSMHQNSIKAKVIILLQFPKFEKP